MQTRQDIKIGDFTYQVFYEKNCGYKEFNYLISYDLIEDFPIVHDIYFSQDSDYQTIYPVPNSKNCGFSIDKDDFTTDVINKRDTSKNVVKLKYDKIRIYHPYNKPYINSIIYFNTIVNDVTIHLFCQRMDQLAINATTIFNIGNDSYSEYVEFEIPNIEDLLNSEQTVSNLMYNQDTCLKDIFQPFRIMEDLEGNEYAEQIVDYNNTNTLTLPIDVIMFPYKEIDSTTNRFIVSDELTPNMDTFFNDYRLLLKASIGFNENHQLCVIGEFTYKGITDKQNVVSLYKQINGISEDSKGWYITVYNQNDVEHKLYYKDISQQAVIEDVDDTTDETMQYLSEDGTPTYFSPFKITIIFALDSRFKNIVKTIQLPLNGDYAITEFDSFMIPIEDTLYNWNQYPEILVGIIQWQDAVMGITVTSNPFTLTKERFKYLIDKNNNKSNNYMNLFENSKIQLIEGINCYVKSDTTEQKATVTGMNTPKVIIKPVFYKVGELQSITLLSYLTQNIGINLIDYMTKVDTFILSIEGNQFNEIARNDQYVIFSIDSSQLVSNSGVYHLLNEDQEYITSGKYTVS